MHKKIFFFFLFLQVGQSFPAFPQPGDAVMDKVTKEKELFIRSLSSGATDPTMTTTLVTHFAKEVDRIHKSIRTNYHLSVLDKEKAERSLVFFIKELSDLKKRESSCIYDIPGNLQAYESVLKTVLYRAPILPILRPMNAQRTQLMAASFSQYSDHPLMEDVAVFKRVLTSPEFILNFVENRPTFRFNDSLLLTAAAHDPARIIYYLKKGKPVVQERLRRINNIYLRQIVALSDDKLAPVFLPFLTQVAENKMSREEIQETRTDVTAYFQLLVNTLQGTVRDGSSASAFQQTLRKGIRQKAQAFYVNVVNELHNSSDAVRFASVKDLRPEDLYYVIISSGDELYTSSYLGLYKRLMEHFKAGVADSLVDIVNNDGMHEFIRLAANYNVLSDLLSRLSDERKATIMKSFITGVEKEEERSLERAMDIADAIAGTNKDSASRELIGRELQLNLQRTTRDKQYLGVRLYRILADILQMTGEEDGLKKLWATLGDYELLKQSALRNANGEIIELVLFYGDEDGISSFSNFLRHYTNDKKWEVKSNEHWVSIRSLSGQPVILYANKPLDIESGLDLGAQDSLMSYLKQQAHEPTVLVHRGHSYHLDKTLRRMNSSVRLAVLGSCGSYNRSISIATINPHVQVIGSRKMGAKSINDPIIETINETLLSGQDLHWPQIWESLTNRFKKDGTSLSLFNEYFPPSHNLGLFVLKLFNYFCSGN